MPDGTLVLGGMIAAGSTRQIVVPKTQSRILVPAESRPLTADQLALSLTKTGGTPFAIREFVLDYAGGLFAPVSELNRVRREFLSSAQTTLIQAALPSEEQIHATRERLSALTKDWRTPSLEHSPSPMTSPVNLAVSTDKLEGVAAAVKAGADVVCFEPTFHPSPTGCAKPPDPDDIAAQIREALACCRTTKTRMVWKFPRITRQGFLDMAITILPALASDGLTGCMVNSTGAARAIRSAVPGMEIAGSIGLNVFNHLALDELSRVPFHLVTLSPEMLSAGR